MVPTDAAADSPVVEKNAGDSVENNVLSTTDAEVNVAASEQQQPATTPAAPKAPEKPLEVIPQGNYTLVAIDVDTTGRRLIDEIVQLAAYTPNDSFSQYIMPYMNLNPAARQRHQVRVVSIGFYRMLKSTDNFKIIKTKSEVIALKEFLVWLEAIKDKDAASDGIVLVYHEERKFIPYMVLASMLKYELVERFFNTVKAFVNGVNLARLLHPDFRNVSLRRMTRILNIEVSASWSASSGETTTSSERDVNSTTVSPLKTADGRRERRDRRAGRGRDERNYDHYVRPDGSALVRAKMTYELANVLTKQLQQKQIASCDADANAAMTTDATNDAGVDKLLLALQPYAQKIQVELKELQVQNEILERQATFRPIFLSYFKSALFQRVRAVRFRIILAEHGYDLQKFNEIWQQKQKEGLTAVLADIEALREQDKTELVNLIDSYLDPNKVLLKPQFRPNRFRRNRRDAAAGNGSVRRNVGTRSKRQQTTRNEEQHKNADAAKNSQTVSVEQGAGGDKPASNNHADNSANAAGNGNSVSSTVAQADTSSTVKREGSNAAENGKSRNRRSQRGGRGRNKTTRPLSNRRSAEVRNRANTNTRVTVHNQPAVASVSPVATPMAVAAN